MTPDEFRRFALLFKDAFEHAHFGHPDFRIGSRIFATLGYPDIDFGMVKLTPEQQQLFMAAAPEAFSPSKGAWGTSGSTLVRLAAVAPAMLQDALNAAWHDAVAKSASKRTTKSAATKRAATKRATTKRATTKRATTKRATTKRATTKRATMKRATTKRAATKRAPAKRAKPSRPSALSPQPSRKAPPPPRKRSKKRHVTGGAR